MSSQNSTCVHFVPLAHFDWSFARKGPLPWNPTVWCIIAVFTAVPLWCTLELTVWVFYTFRRWTGLYFWSVLVCTWGVAIHAIGFVLKFLVPSCPWLLSTILVEIGWVAMVSGFSFVLYSRLHLVVQSRRLLRAVLAVIVIDGILIHTPTVVFQFGLSNPTSHERYVKFMDPMERIQIAWFSTQETIISAIYVYATLDMLKGNFNRKVRTTIGLLILIQIICFLCDVLVTTLDYLQFYTLKAVIHSFIYALKLQLEFVILNQFRDVLAKGGMVPSGLTILQLSPQPTVSPPSTPCSLATKPAGKSWWKVLSTSVGQTNKLPSPQLVHNMSEDKAGRPSDESVSNLGCGDESKAGLESEQTFSNSGRPPLPRQYRLASEATLQGTLTPKDRSATTPCETQSLSDVERQYLGAWRWD